MSMTFARLLPEDGARLRAEAPAPGRAICAICALNGKIELSPETLYTGMVSELPPPENLGPCSFILYEDAPLPEAYAVGKTCNFLLTRDPDAYVAAKNRAGELLEARAKAGELTYRLLCMCQDGAQPEELLQAGSALFGNPLLLLDAALMLRAHAGGELARGGGTVEHTLRSGYMPPHFLDAVSRAAKWDEDIAALPDGASAAVVGRIARGGETVGYAALFGCCRAVSECDRELLRVLCKFLALTDFIAGSRRAAAAPEEDFLSALLETRGSDGAAAEERVRRFGLRFPVKMRAVAVGFAPEAPGPGSAEALARRVRDFFSSYAIVRGGRVLALLDESKRRNYLSGQSRAGLERFLADNGCAAGFSQEFGSVADFCKRGMQASACLDMRAMLGVRDTVMLYDDWRVTHMLLNFRDACRLEELIPEDIKTLLEADRERGTDMTETLFSFVRHNCSITASARDMNVHYNTMKYRINRIKELIHIDFEDAGLLERVIIPERVLRLMEMLESRAAASAE